MSNHKIALVPLASGYLQSPELLARGRKADTGLFAESLIYYDSVYVHVDNPEQFTNFISLLVQQGLSYEALNELIEEGSLRFFNTVFIMPFMPNFGPGRRNIVSSFYAVQEKAMTEPNYFTKRFLGFESLKNSFSNLSGFDKKTFDKFCQLAEEKAITFPGEIISQDIVENAYEDFLNPVRCKLITKNILKELYRVHQLGEVPDFEVKIREMDSENYDEIAHNFQSAIFRRNSGGNGNKIYEVDYKIDTNNLRSLEEDKQLISFQTLPLSCAGISNLYIKSAGKLNCDLFLSKPISRIVGNKLYEISDLEISRKDLKIRNVIENLEAKVEFPDLHRLVNLNKVDFKKVLEVRIKAKRFREWLQTESERDRDAIIAYHHEVAKLKRLYEYW